MVKNFHNNILTNSFIFSSLRSVIEKPPIGGKELLPLTSVQLAGFRLHPGPVRNTRYMRNFRNVGILFCNGNFVVFGHCSRWNIFQTLKYWVYPSTNILKFSLDSYCRLSFCFLVNRNEDFFENHKKTKFKSKLFVIESTRWIRRECIKNVTNLAQVCCVLNFNKYEFWMISFCSCRNNIVTWIKRHRRNTRTNTRSISTNRAKCHWVKR